MMRPVKPEESTRLIQLGSATGLFTPEDAEFLLGQTLRDLHSGQLPEGHQAHAWTHGTSDEPVAWAYFAPTPKSNGVWDLWWIGVHPRHHGTGVGTAFLSAIEAKIRASEGRLLVIETSSLPPLEATRRFYRNRGYRECGSIPDFYGPGDDKVIFARVLS